jgi:NAD(P)H-hydrate epimerase
MASGRAPMTARRAAVGWDALIGRSMGTARRSGVNALGPAPAARHNSARVQPQPEIPILSRARVRELDRRAIEEYGIPGVVLMENAGANASRWILERAAREGWRQPSAGIACGAGNNGGDGYVVARHLANAGWDVHIASTVAPGELRGDAAVMARIARAMGIPCDGLGEGRTLLVDALLGTGFQGALKPELARAIGALNAAPARLRVALDLPSGLDADSGERSDPCVRADATLTFAALKPGLLEPAARAHVGELVLIDIGAPRALLADLARGT